MKTWPWFRIALGALLLAAIALAVTFRDRLDPAALETWIAGFGITAPVVFVAVYALASVLFLPGMVMTLAGGALFGPVWGTLINLLGATLGAMAAFLVARYLGADWVSRRLGGRLKELVAGVEAEGWRFVAFVRLVPLFPYNLLNYALGLTRIRLLAYIVATFVFMAPGAFAYTYVGYAGRQAVAGGEAAIQTGLIALALLAAVAFIPRLVKRVRGAASWISAPQLAAQLAGDNPPVVVDVRSPKEFRGELGCIDGALNLPLDELESRLHELPADRPLALVCHTDRRSRTAARLLQGRGYTQVAVVRKGMTAWRR
ncbi:SNARE associated golgi family protein [Thioalkalivibrio nitratireducens DSM 14787]|uniref:TVP38/TMEM64 family membrane protein n=1 Tax=Thioalkalivibrio nitratireducens (strain DSM 14787 / UNIQEM 213 / ALEN2) TaxID=1255043 RepID=L0DWH8_THIND|nr:VTT domain-containing protein [Thioalkalivibrio nitratireducens]AGA33373.1 SNARE associated golgi family protein [Thioalkalivibrio nitratireducens DSM 14787]